MDKVKEILAKESLDEHDIKYLMDNKSFLSQADLSRLGLAPAIEAVKEPVREPEPTSELSGEAKAAVEIKKDQELPPERRKGRPRVL